MEGKVVAGHVEVRDVPQGAEPVQLACDVLARVRVMHRRMWSMHSCELDYLKMSPLQ